jgi:serine/threonine-protein kinase RsbW
MIAAHITGDTYGTTIAAVMEQLKKETLLCETDDVYYSLQLALWELTSNIIRHSNKKKADFFIHWNDDQFTIEVFDYGDGFDWRPVLSKTVVSPRQLGGRGLFLIQQIAQHFSFDESGKKATVIIKRQRR